MRFRGLFTAFALLSLTAAGRADVKPNALFTDGMVLQQNVKCPVWGKANPGEAVEIMLGKEGENKGIALSGIKADQDGNWRGDLPPRPAGGPYTLTIGGKAIKDVYFGEVWIASGQSNMWWTIDLSETPDWVKTTATNTMVRFFTVPQKASDEPQKNVDAKWVVSSPKVAGGFSAVAYHFAVDLQRALQVPVGIIHTSWGGTYAEAWTPKETLAGHEDLKHIWTNYEPTIAKANKGNPNRPAVLYNAMIAPLQPYAIKGAIWYQGESNAGRAHAYQTLFPVMIESWRKTWNQGDFPFLAVQLAPFTAIKPEPGDSDWAELREAQLMATKKLKNVGMAVITDAGDTADIHPKPKQIVGQRLALAAYGIGYDGKIEYSGPIYKGMEVKETKVGPKGKEAAVTAAVLSFDHVGKGLESRGGAPKGFTIAGEDKKFYPAQAQIQGNYLAVWSPMVSKPAAVRYGWANYPVVNLWNKDGLPASPFRTDEWPGVTHGKK